MNCVREKGRKKRKKNQGNPNRSLTPNGANVQVTDWFSVSSVSIFGFYHHHEPRTHSLSFSLTHTFFFLIRRYNFLLSLSWLTPPWKRKEYINILVEKLILLLVLVKPHKTNKDEKLECDMKRKDIYNKKNPLQQ